MCVLPTGYSWHSSLKKKYEFYDGFVICHGTDTMAYTAAALSYLIQNNRRPIVITGAQKPIDLAITDARSNLLDSLRFASHDRAHGVSIVFGGKVIAGTRAKKEFSKSYNAFSSINYPDIASIHDNKIIFYIDDKDHNTHPLVFYHQMNTNIFLYETDSPEQMAGFWTLWLLPMTADIESFRSRRSSKLWK